MYANYVVAWRFVATLEHAPKRPSTRRAESNGSPKRKGVPCFSVSGRSEDGATEWQKINDGRHLYTGTNGEGGFRLDLNGKSPVATSPDEIPSSPMSNFLLEQNYPNPFKPETVIRYTLREPAHVRLDVLNILGSEVATVVNGEHVPTRTPSTRPRSEHPRNRSDGTINRLAEARGGRTARAPTLAGSTRWLRIAFE